MMTDRLKPCPFCGETPPNDDAQFYVNQGTKWGGVQCCCGGPEVRTGYQPVAHWKVDAIREWNTRPLEDKAYAEGRRAMAEEALEMYRNPQLAEYEDYSAALLDIINGEQSRRGVGS